MIIAGELPVSGFLRFHSGIDLAFPYIIEANMVKPGGLSYHQLAAGEDRSSEVVNTVLAAVRSAGKLK
ncbi:hypothetical protein [Streptomyces sp. NPDC002851]